MDPIEARGLFPPTKSHIFRNHEGLATAVAGGGAGSLPGRGGRS